MANTVQVIVSVTDRASAPLGGITGALGNMASVAGGIVSADLIGRIGEGLLAVGRAGFDGARGIENATARLNAFTKDTAVSTEILNQLRMEAAKTPFAFEDMANAGANLLPVANQLNMDLMDLVRTAEILAASNPAEGLAGAAFALKEAASGDFTSIVERFNLSRSAIQALKDEGVPNLEIVARAMSDAGLDMDLVSNMANTFDGRMSTLIDTFREVAIAFATPIFNVLSGGLADAQISLEQAMPALLDTAKTWGQLAADSITTFREAWAGEWEDNEIIQPVHRFIGNTTTAIKDMWTDLKEPAQEASDYINGVWQGNVDAIEDLKKAWGPFNKILSSGAYFFSELNRLGEEISIHFGTMENRTGDANKQFRETVTLGEALARWFAALADTINRMASFVAHLANEWARLNDNMAGGIKQTGGGPPGPGDTPDTAPGATAGQGNVVTPIPPMGAGDVPDTSPAGPQGATTSGGSGGRGQTTIAQPMVAGAGSNIFYMTVNNALDIEEVAYRVAEIIQSRRSDT